MLTYGSLFSGYGGLDMGVQSVLPGRTAWHVEFDDNPAKVLAHNWPGVPNYGDVTAVDWATVEPVDVLTGGFPCQDVSHAGRRAGLIRDGEGRTRSGLWGEMLRAIDTLRPRLVAAENVRGLLSAQADSDVEPCPWCMGDAGASPLRALGAVLGDLAELGYDASWYGLRAADVEAAHGRFRVFIFAWPAGADTEPVPLGEHGDDGGVEAPAAGRVRADGHPVDAGQVHTGGLGAALGLGLEGYEVPLMGTPRASEWKGTGPVGSKSHKHRLDRDYLDAQMISLADEQVLSPATAAGGIDWGDYAPAIARWEQVMGRPAPYPTEPGPKGNPQLAAAFTEWLMGLPEGHVTDPAIGISRNAQLQALGNGVVPAQSAAATAAWVQDMRQETTP